jgi:hypothetical protein
MGFWDTITDLVEAATPWSTADADAPAKESVCVTFNPPSCCVLSLSLACAAGCAAAIRHGIVDSNMHPSLEYCGKLDESFKSMVTDL